MTWEVIITRIPSRLQTEITFLETYPNGELYAHRYNPNKGDTYGWEAECVDSQQPIKPSLIIPEKMVRSGFLEALVSALGNTGIKTINEHRMEGELTAVRYHLEDMRRIAMGKVKA